MTKTVLGWAATTFTALAISGIVVTVFLAFVVQTWAGAVAYGALTAMYVWVAIGLWIEKEAERQRCEIRWS